MWLGFHQSKSTKLIIQQRKPVRQHRLFYPMLAQWQSGSYQLPTCILSLKHARHWSWPARCWLIIWSLLKYHPCLAVKPAVWCTNCQPAAVCCVVFLLHALARLLQCQIQWLRKSICGQWSGRCKATSIYGLSLHTWLHWSNALYKSTATTTTTTTTTCNTCKITPVSFGDLQQALNYWVLHLGPRCGFPTYGVVPSVVNFYLHQHCLCTHAQSSPSHSETADHMLYTCISATNISNCCTAAFTLLSHYLRIQLHLIVSNFVGPSWKVLTLFGWATWRTSSL